MKKYTILKILLSLTLVGVVFVIGYRMQPEPDHILDPNIQWKTDTIKVPEPYTVPVPYDVEVPPRIVKIYEVDSTAIDSLKLLMFQDSIIISGLKNQVAIHQNYLKQFPYNPKLINFDLVFDTLSLTLLDIDGITSAISYPIFIEFYKYNWSAGELTREDNIRQIPQQKNYLNYKFGLGYDLLYVTPYLQGEISKDISKFELYGRIGVGLLNIESSEIKLGANYNLDRNGKN